MAIYVQLKSKLPTRWNMIGRSMTDLPPVLSPSSVLPPPLSHCAFIPATKNAAHFEIVFISIFSFKNCVTGNRQVGEGQSRNMNLQNAGRAKPKFRRQF